MKKTWLKQYLKITKSLQNSSQLKRLASFLNAPHFWAYDQQAVARGVAAGLAGAVIPGFQIFYAAILVILLRGNLPIALVFTLITNPFTVVPITYLIYTVGRLTIGSNKKDFVIKDFQWDISSWQAFWDNVSAWVLQFGKAFFVGLPIVSIFLGIIGYFSTILLWNIAARFIRKKKSRH